MDIGAAIVGIDPGTTVGVAIVDLNGCVSRVFSLRNPGLNDTIAHITKHCSPALFTTDKAKTPQFVSKVASVTGARVFSPPADLSVEKKRELTGSKSLKTPHSADPASGTSSLKRTANIAIKNPHEMDALAAALYAYNNFQNKLRRVDKQILEAADKTKARVLNGETVESIFETNKKPEKPPDFDARLQKQNKENVRLRRKIEALEKAPKKDPDSKYVQKLEKARELIQELAIGKLIPVKKAHSAQFSDLVSLNLNPGDVVYIKSGKFDSNGLRLMEARRVRTALSPRRLPCSIPIANAAYSKLTTFEDFSFVHYKDTDILFEEAPKNGKNLDSKELENIVESYRTKR